MRNSVPDAPGGGGADATLSLYVNGGFERKLTPSSQHSWLYGNTDSPEGLTNTPGGDARRLCDESHALLAQSYPAGTTFRLQRDAGDTAAYYVIDLVDLEQVAPPAPKPAECTSITDYGAVPDDGNDDTAALQKAVTADQNGQIACVWIPQGQWRQEQKILTDAPLNRGQYNQVGISNAEGAVGLNGRFGKHTKITNVRIDGSNNGAGIRAHGGARGSATLSNVTITGSADGDVLVEPGSQFVVNGG